MVVATYLYMPATTNLIEEIEAFALRKPGHRGSVGALLGTIRRIDAEFTGETREALLSEARKTFLRQIQILENTEQTLEALETLRANQERLVNALKKLTVRRRPEGVTLH
jgi:hypothetical protein